ncbi:MAG: hypothetical protein AAGB22_12135, partial [Bacteroidota bacterium]
CPNNDLALNEQFFNGAGSDFVNTANINYYDQVPKKQANSDILTLGGTVSNEGNANQPNARINVTVSGPPPAFSGNSSPVALMVDSSDFLDASATFVPGNTVGPRSVVWWVASDSALAPGPQNSFLADDTLIQSFRVSDRVYAWDDGNSIGGNAFNNGSNYSMFQRFEFQEDDTITSVLFNWFNNTVTGTGTSHGSIVTVSVYPVTGNTTIANGGGIDLTVPPLAQEQFVSLNSNDFNIFSEVIFTTPAIVDASTVQEVLVGFSVVSGSAWINVESFDDEDTQVQQTFVDVDNDDVIDGFSRRTPFIRINTIDNQICQNTNINITTASVLCQPNFEADIDITVGGNPNGNVAFAWSGPNGFAATTEDVTVDAEGVYTVTVTDQSNCSNTHSVTVDNSALPCNVSVPELDGSALQLAIYPNPGDGEVILTVSNTPRHQFQLEVHNMMGQLVYSDQVIVHDGAPTSLDLREL